MRSTVCAFNRLCVQRYLARQGEVCWNAPVLAWNMCIPSYQSVAARKVLLLFWRPVFLSSGSIWPQKTKQQDQSIIFSITFVNIVVVMFAKTDLKRILCFSLNILFIFAFSMEFSLVTNSKAKLELCALRVSSHLSCASLTVMCTDIAVGLTHTHAYLCTHSCLCWTHTHRYIYSWTHRPRYNKMHAHTPPPPPPKKKIHITQHPCTHNHINVYIHQ